MRAAETRELVKADSLFEQKKYTESFDLYEQILDEEQLASPKMLLKMAFIKEGLGDYSRALYFLNVYYQKVILINVLNYSNVNSQAIIIESNSYLMSGPSSGADFVEIVDKGHRVKTFDEHGPWLEILWNDKVVYIKKNRVKKLG
jgi:uncharacterized protein YgiM (DUF1202 family)